MKEKQSIIKFLILAVILAVALTAGFATGAMKTAALTADWTLSLRAILRLAAMAAGVLLAEWVAEFFLTLCKPRTHRARSILSITRSLLRYAAAIVILCWGLHLLGVNILAIVASLGVLALIVGFAADSIIADLQQNQEWEETVRVAFPEGYNAFQMGDALEEAGLCTREEFIEALNTHDFDVDFISEVSDDPLKLVKLDGFLFPATYEFFADEDVDSIILRMLRAFEENVLTEETLSALEDSGYTLEELVIFASIIQKEAANVEEMYNVSSVFTNRMAEGSPYPQLESCTTNNYIEDYITPYYDGNPPQEVLDAYDTYGKTGLPVGAIANPGLDAIDAALHPEKNTLDGTYYFFVTDVEYTHYYGRTYEEHLQNIEKAKAVNREYGIEGLIS